MDKSKRNLAKVLGIAGTTSAIWTKPAVDAVVLPTHAETSCEQNCVSGFTNDRLIDETDAASCEECAAWCRENYPTSAAMAIWGGIQGRSDNTECYCHEIVDCLEPSTPTSYYFTTMLVDECPPPICEDVN